MNDYTPKRRRGRPPATAVPGPALTNAVMDVLSGAADPLPEGVKPAQRRRRASTGGFHLKLSAPQREGYQRRWFNDMPGRLAEADELAYSHVTETGIKSDSPDSRVRRLVGTQASGQPLYAYLMETPQAEYEAGIQDKEQAHSAFEEAIRRGEDVTGSGLTKVRSHASSIEEQ